MAAGSPAPYLALGHLISSLSRRFSERGHPMQPKLPGMFQTTRIQSQRFRSASQKSSSGTGTYFPISRAGS